MNCQGMCWKCCRKSIKIPCDNDQKCRYMLYYLQLVYYWHISLRHLVEFVPSFPVIFLFFFHICRKWFYTLANLPAKSRCKLGYVMYDTVYSCCYDHRLATAESRMQSWVVYFRQRCAWIYLWYRPSAESISSKFRPLVG